MVQANDFKGKILIAIISLAFGIGISLASYNLRSTLENKAAIIATEKDVNVNAKAIDKIEITIRELTSEIKKLNDTLTEIRVLLSRQITSRQPNAGGPE